MSEAEQAKKASGLNLSERLKDALPETYQGVVKKFQERGLQFRGVELDAGEIKLKFYSDYNNISFAMYKLLLDKFNYMKIQSSLCESGGTALACLELTVAMPYQA